MGLQGRSVRVRHHRRGDRRVVDPVGAHRDGVAEHVVHDDRADCARILRVLDLRAERADAAVDDRDLARDAVRDRRTSVGRNRVRRVSGNRGTEVREGPDRRADRRPLEAAERRIVELHGDSHVVRVRARARRDDVRRGARRFDCESPRSGVACGDRRDDARIHGRVQRVREQVVRALDAAPDAQVDHVHPVDDGLLNAGHDVVAEGAPLEEVEADPHAREHVVVVQGHPGSDAAEESERGRARRGEGEVGGVDVHGAFLFASSDRTCDVRPVIEDNVGPERNSAEIGPAMDDRVRCAAARDERVGVEDARVHHADLDLHEVPVVRGPGEVDPEARPNGGCVDERN